MTQQAPVPDRADTSPVPKPVSEYAQIWKPLVLRGLGLVVGAFSLTAVGLLNASDAGTALESVQTNLTTAGWVSASSTAPPRPSASPEATANAMVATPASSVGGDTPRRSPCDPATSEGAARTPTDSTGTTRPDESRNSEGSVTGAPPTVGITVDGKVVLNVASAEELTRLPGVGFKRATRIVQLRSRLKRFRHISDLLRIRGIGPKSLAKMKPHLILEPPPQPAATPADPTPPTSG